MKNYKPIISKNIVDLRVELGMTQAELAKRLNYSDKAVSKWERGESLPDIAVLAEIAEIFGVTLDYLVQKNHQAAPLKEEAAVQETEPAAALADAMETEPLAESALSTNSGGEKDSSDSKGEADIPSDPRMHPEYVKRRKVRHAIVTATGIGLVWIAALFSFSVIRGILNSSKHWDWLIFVYAVPASIIVWLIFNTVWFNKRRNYLIVSILMWSVLITIHLTMLPAGINLWLIFIPGIPAQIIFYIWSLLAKKSREDKELYL